MQAKDAELICVCDVSDEEATRDTESPMLRNISRVTAGGLVLAVVTFCAQTSAPAPMTATPFLNQAAARVDPAVPVALKEMTPLHWYQPATCATYRAVLVTVLWPE